jgi:hypothetical protein
MLRRFLLRLKSRLHAHGSARRDGRFSHSRPVRRAGSSSIQKERRTEELRWPACPAECPLCDKHCILAQPRCRHGEAFIQFMRTHGGDPRTRPL